MVPQLMCGTIVYGSAHQLRYRYSIYGGNYRPVETYVVCTARRWSPVAVLRDVATYIVYEKTWRSCAWNLLVSYPDPPPLHLLYTDVIDDVSI